MQEHKKSARGQEGGAGLSPPPPGVESSVSPMWRSRGNSFDLLHSDPANLGVKLNNRTGGPDVFRRLHLGMHAVFLPPCGKRGRSASPSRRQES